MWCNRLDVFSRWLKTKGPFKFIFSDIAFIFNAWIVYRSRRLVSESMTPETRVRYLEKSYFWIFEFWFLWYFLMLWGIYTIIWTEIITTTVVALLPPRFGGSVVSHLSSLSWVQFLSSLNAVRGPDGGYHRLLVDGCSLKRPRPWWGVRSGWL